ncbi:MAG: hypothetical protein PVJ71_01225, partial [Lysobacterales bacterium]
MNNTIDRILALGSLLLALGAQVVAANPLHPEVPILDANGNLVIESGEPMSSMATCGGDCHQTAYIMANSDHSDAGVSRLGDHGGAHDWQRGPGYFGGWNPLAYDTDGLSAGGMEIEAWLKRYGARHVGGGPAASLVDMDCLLCHAHPGAFQVRADTMAAGDFAWANSAALAAIGVIAKVEGRWQWDAMRFKPNGALLDGLLDIRNPRDENCAQCHGMVDNSLDVPLTVPADLSARHNTERTGQIVSPQKLLNSGLNISGKEALDHPFDVHSDRVVGCVDCHYSLNNPVYFEQREESRPVHLAFDPRRLTNAEFLYQPLHQFAKGQATLGLASETDNSMRRCDACHE